MIGTIGVRGLRVTCVIGVHADERRTRQDVFCDIELDVDFSAAADTDDVANTVDYDTLSQAMMDLADEGEFRLIETYAESAARQILDEFGALRVLVEIRKPSAVVGADFAMVRVERFSKPTQR